MKEIDFKEVDRRAQQILKGRSGAHEALAQELARRVAMLEVRLERLEQLEAERETQEDFDTKFLENTSREGD